MHWICSFFNYIHACLLLFPFTTYKCLRICSWTRGHETIFRSTQQRCSATNGVIRNFSNNTCVRDFIKKEALAQVLSCEFCEISKNTFLQNTSGRLLLHIEIRKRGHILRCDQQTHYLLVFQSFYWSSLENYTSNNTSQHGTTGDNTSTTRANNTTKVQLETTRHNTRQPK